MFFKDVIGQQKVKDFLIQSVSNNRIPHAQLFLGKDGFGSLPLAIAYAQYINCLQKQENDSCGTCSSCVKYQKLAHPDLHFIFPTNTNEKVKKDPNSDVFLVPWREMILQQKGYFNLFDWLMSLGIENKQGNIAVEDAQRVIGKLNLRAYEAEYKVVVIWHAEKMNTSTANKLLKSFEEPSPKTLFILICDDIEGLLPTIISRTQIVKVGKIEKEKIAEYYRDKNQIPAEQLENYISLGEGDLLKINSFFIESESAATNKELYISLFRLAYSAKYGEIITWSEKPAALGREQQRNFISYCLEMIRNSLVCANVGVENIHLQGEEKSFVQNFSPYLMKVGPEYFYEKFNEADYHILRNANPKILFLNMALQFMLAFAKAKKAVA